MTKKPHKPFAPAHATESACGARSWVVTSWRDMLPIHPAAEMFPMMSPSEVKEVAADIRKNGLKIPIAVWRAGPDAPLQLVDGRTRLDATEIAAGVPVMVHGAHIKTAAGRRVPCFDGLGMVEILDPSVDPWAYAISTNIHRRHLTLEQKRDLISALLKAKPESSNNAIAKQTKADDKTVAKVRRELEGRSEIPNVEIRTDTKGRRQPARKSVTASSKAKASTKAKAPGLKAPTRGRSLLEINEKDDHKMRLLETRIIGLESEVEDAKAGFHLDPDVYLFQDALIKRVSKLNGEERKRLFAALYEVLRPPKAAS